jgi:voltage-gated potassium channel
MHHPASSSGEQPPRALTGLYHWLFDHRHPGGWAQSFERWIALLIVCSVAAVVLERIPEIYEPYAAHFHWFDVISVGVFTVEYLLRWLSASANPEFAHHRFPRLRYMVSFYALIDLVAIAPFYFAGFFAVDVEALRVLRTMRLLRMAKFSRQLVPAWHEFQRLNRHRTWRAKVYALLEPTGHSGRLHFYVDNFIVFWIALSIVCVVLESVDSVRTLFAVQFHWVDVMAFSVFTLEYIARVYSAPENPAWVRLSVPRLRHMRTGQALIDLVTIVPFLVEHFIPNQMDLRFLRVFRLMRMLKLTRYTSATQTLLKVLQREWQVIFASVFVMLLLVVLTASLGYMFEHDLQPDKFENIPQSIYWAVITLASVGYGDISPITPMGRALTVVLALVGIGIFAIPAGLLASAFTDQLRLDREAFKLQILRAFEDGNFTPQEQEAVIAEAERLHLAKEEYQRLIDEARRDFDDKNAAQSLQLGALMLDATAHPALAAEQFRIMVAQLQLLLKATGANTLEAALASEDGTGLVATKVLAALRPPQESETGTGAEQMPSGG